MRGLTMAFLRRGEEKQMLPCYCVLAPLSGALVRALWGAELACLKGELETARPHHGLAALGAKQANVPLFLCGRADTPQGGAGEGMVPPGPRNPEAAGLAHLAPRGHQPKAQGGKGPCTPFMHPAPTTIQYRVHSVIPAC